ncbi:MAG: Eco29kI family restriction endonuclease [Micromonosporaceae bacterium]
MQVPRPYNPLDRVELGKSVERALLAQPLELLPPGTKFAGAGLYAIYYVGELDYYYWIAPPQEPAGAVPIYVGRARPPGARQGALGLEATTTKSVLFDRLSEHSRSIENVERHWQSSGADPNLTLADFRCRYLVADDIWVPLGEALLIGHYRPVWNVLVDGFGNHAPGGGRSRQARSSWDTLHPGRGWATRLPRNPRTSQEIQSLVAAHLATIKKPDLDMVPVIDDQVQDAMVFEPDE